jgi:hypothetical protein
MATTYEVNSWKNEPAVARPQAGVHERYKTFTLTTGVINDVYKIFRLPKGAKLLPLGWYIESPDVDTNATPTVKFDLIVTDGTTTKTVIADTVVGQAGGTVFDQTATVGQQTGWVNYVTTNGNFYVALKIDTASATHASGSVIVGCKYSIDLESGSV